MRYSILLLFGISFLLCACEKEQASTSTAYAPVQLPAVKNIPVEDIEIYAGVDQLRVRELPSLDSRVLVELVEGDTLYYLNTETVRTMKLNLRGKTYNAPWIKVRTQDDKQGWTYGGAVNSSK
ncbi:MAG: SH3 domain-containing protein [Bacteroidota bacterium]